MGMIPSRGGEKEGVRQGSNEEVETLLFIRQVSLAEVGDITGGQAGLIISFVSSLPAACA